MIRLIPWRITLVKGACMALTLIAISSPQVRGATREPMLDSAVCADWAGKPVSGARIDSAVWVPRSGDIGEYCRLQGSIHTALKFEVHLPRRWNHKFLFEGGGGWDGVIFTPEEISASAYSGYVIAASNGGKAQGDYYEASAFLNDPQAQRDFAYLSTHTVLAVAKDIVRLQYGASVARSYFEGCSNGGREALIEASRFPDDFDGIIARAPAYSFTELFQAFIANSKAVARPGGWISPAKAKLITSAIRKKCDALDGIADGIVSNQQACSFDPADLKCSGSDGESCLTGPEINTAKTAYSELRGADGSLIYPGWGPGGEDLGWPGWLSGTAPGKPGLQFAFGDGFLKYWVLNDPTEDTYKFDPQNHVTELALVATALDASPDLRDFFGKGHKLILAHGTNDWAVSYKGSIKYFRDVGTSIGSERERDKSMEFFLLPGVQHCTGGVGAATVDWIEAMSRWTEKGERPSSQHIFAKKTDAASKIEFTRPLCAYPQYPRYGGSGAAEAGENFTCQAP
jgi:hypothetical protein